MTHRPLTELAQQAVAKVLHSGDLAIDATVGNGHDTLFLARRVAPDGRLIGFDVQHQALDSARDRLRAAGMQPLTALLQCGHERMAQQVPPEWAGRVGAVMFNLGYLPGGDKTRITAAATTVAALDQAATLLRVGGLISLLVYRGHGGADDEVKAVAAWLDRLGSHFQVTRHDSPGPRLYLIEKTA
jgi:hypothetical protein